MEYVRGGGGIFKDMAVHDLDMSRFLMGSEPTVRSHRSTSGISRHRELGLGRLCLIGPPCLRSVGYLDAAVIASCSLGKHESGMYRREGMSEA